MSVIEEKARAAAARPVDRLTLVDMDVIGCPFHAYQKLREEAPVFLDRAGGFYVLSRYDDISRALKDTKTFSSDSLVPREEYDRPTQYGGLAQVDTMITSDPPKHRYMRGPLNKLFSLTRVNKMEAYVQQIVDELVDGFIDDGHCDFVRQYTVPLPMYVIADQLGVTRDDLSSFARWSDAFATLVSGFATEEDKIWAAKQNVEMQNYFLKVIPEKRKNPTEDVISDLARAKLEDGQPMRDVDILSSIHLLLTAGNETTTNSMSLAMRTLIEHPDQMQALRDDPSLMDGFIEESLRFDGPVQGLMRRTTCDVEVGGVMIPKDSMVNLRFGSGNRDEAKYTQPEQFNVCRKEDVTHLAFGQGTHFCLGASLARKEISLTFSTLLRRMRNIRLVDPSAEMEYERNMALRSLKHLHIAFDKA
ncbi:MAG: cytochrome P450 [Alphaproteobacteria bacterium]|nr:cytochrome P450 [Alphaproteobacteria bacterium]